MRSDAKARKARPGEKDYKLTDEKGRFLLVHSNGSKLWQHKYRFAGKESKASYGAYPEVSIKEARNKRDETRALLRDGKNPRVEKLRQVASAGVASEHTFESLAREWHDLQSERWTDRHSGNVLRSLERDVFPMLGAVPPADITAPLVLVCLRQVEGRHAIETARRIRQRISMVFVYGISLGLLSEDPAATVKPAMKPMRSKGRQPAVTEIVELRELIEKVESSPAYPVTILASRFLALTAQRPGTVRHARWEDMLNISLDDDAPAPSAIWHIPADEMKLTRDRKEDVANDHIVPLVPEAVAVLRAVRGLSGRAALVCPGQRHTHRPLSENAIDYLYNRVGWHGRHVPHGWRALFSTIMNERRREDRAVIDMMLAHVPKDKVEAAYNRAEHMTRRREIAMEWAGCCSRTRGQLKP
ncbi:tyrosine-type recombinase/integrase [Qipengyuania flava]|uniref:tyrosine-type recombinase/integrase n=1 Tax=Qipengyuania flava TaxID=192812 RepID=UPI001C62AC24|nr:integrase arm-type DNA-binding domain-containing protein [Qipengyuania flava]QYJ08325.1 integrase arm-type DNA-binding domain-containing protein [Qipengyuania flava]